MIVAGVVMRTIAEIRHLDRRDESERRLLRIRIADAERMIVLAAQPYEVKEFYDAEWWSEGRPVHSREGTYLPELARWVRVRRDLLGRLAELEVRRRS